MSIEEGNHLSERQVAELMDQAIVARSLAYAPYSHFSVGAAVLAKSGMIYQGCNIENASYSLTICAERVAIVTALLAGETEFQGLAVVAETAVPVAPCGACRQVLAEFHVPLVIMANLAGQYHLETLEKLLPDAFTSADLPNE